jgi:anti-sigma28 factor (negative regulator of flagellin synthesis)
MEGIRGINGVPEPTSERSADVRARRREEARVTASQEDGVRISNEAQEAAGVARLVEIAREQPDVRPDRVAAAREHIEQGEHRRLDIVRRVAQRIRRYLP